MTLSSFFNFNNPSVCELQDALCVHGHCPVLIAALTHTVINPPPTPPPHPRVVYLVEQKVC